MSEIITPDYNNIVANVRIYDLEESLIASGLPMRTTKPDYLSCSTDKDVNRCVKLVNATKTGNGAHGQFLTGIRVAFDLTCSNKMYVEAERYRFLEFVSSQSTMHRITKFNLDNQYCEYVDPRIIEIMKEKVETYNAATKLLETNRNSLTLGEIERASKDLKELYLEILYSNPAGFRLTARMTTNYRCLRNIYIQRKDHSLKEWREFCKWIESLPYSELITGKVDTTEKI